MSDIALSILIGLISIAVGIYFGLRGFPKEIKSVKDAIYELRDQVLNKLEGIDRTVTHIFEVLIHLKSSGTILRHLSNFGTVRITAEPGLQETKYIVEVERGIISLTLIERLSKETGLEEKEKEIFEGRIPALLPVSPRAFIIKVPSTEPAKCTKYLSFFLKWLDTEYYRALERTKQEFEEPIRPE